MASTRTWSPSCTPRAIWTSTACVCICHYVALTDCDEAMCAERRRMTAADTSLGTQRALAASPLVAHNTITSRPVAPVRADGNDTVVPLSHKTPVAAAPKQPVGTIRIGDTIITITR